MVGGACACMRACVCVCAAEDKNLLATTVFGMDISIPNLNPLYQMLGEHLPLVVLVPSN